MAQLSGRNSIVALSAGAAWGTPIAVAALDGILPFNIDRIALDGEVVFDESIGNWGELQEGDLVRHLANPQITLPLRREGMLWRFVAHLIGDDTVTGPVGNVYTHTFNWQDESTLFSSMALEINETASPGHIVEWASLKTVGVVFEPDGDGFWQIVVSTIGDTINIGGDATNTDTEFDLITWATKTKRIGFRESQLRINAQGGAALGSGDVVKCSNIAVNLVRNYPADGELVTRGASTGAEKTTDEPIREGYNDGMILSFTKNDYTTEALLDEFHDETERKADIIVTKTIGSDAHVMTMTMPRLYPISPEVAIERGSRIPMTRNFVMTDATANPTGMSVNTIFHLVLDELQSASYE
jgi:hypothetical protein